VNCIIVEGSDYLAYLVANLIFLLSQYQFYTSFVVFTDRWPSV